jgi:thiamine-monophosphate kinase
LPLVLASVRPNLHRRAAAHYWSPQPQLALGQALRGKATAALDISDGLLADCGHIALASKVRSSRTRALAVVRCFGGFLGRGAERAALSGGDDYVLAFTLPSVELPPLLAEVGRSM